MDLASISFPQEQRFRTSSDLRDSSSRQVGHATRIESLRSAALVGTSEAAAGWYRDKHKKSKIRVQATDLIGKPPERIDTERIRCRSKDGSEQGKSWAESPDLLVGATRNTIAKRSEQ